MNSKTLKLIRTYLELKQNEMARLIKVSHVTYNAIENDKIEISDKILESIYNNIDNNLILMMKALANDEEIGRK